MPLFNTAISTDAQAITNGFNEATNATSIMIEHNIGSFAVATFASSVTFDFSAGMILSRDISSLINFLFF